MHFITEFLYYNQDSAAVPSYGSELKLHIVELLASASEHFRKAAKICKAVVMKDNCDLIFVN